jgi:hypothetical protein
MRLIKSLTWEVQAAYMGEMSNQYRFRMENLKDNNYFGEPGISVNNSAI